MDVWRGGVSAWECDEMGHFNVRFYVARAVEGLGVLAEALGLAPIFTPAAATLVVREQHIRFLREAHAGTALHMTGAILSQDEVGLKVLQILYHSASGDICAAFVTRADYAAPDGTPVSLPPEVRKRAELLQVSLPPEAAPKGISGDALSSIASLGMADRLGLPVTAQGLIAPQDCDAFGRMRPEMMIGRINLGLPHLVRPLRDAMEAAMQMPGRVGGAALEYRILYFRFPGAGTQVRLRSGLSEVRPKWMRLNHWLIESGSGDVLASAEHISVNLDLKLRKALVLEPDLLAAMQTHVRGGVAL